jgi:hypothetical protein
MIAWVAYFFHWPPSVFDQMTITEFLWWFDRVKYVAGEIRRQQGH